MRKFLALLILFGVPLLAYGVYYWNWYSQEKTIQIGETVRRYRLHIPLKSEKQRSLVVMLHGYGDNPRLMEAYSGMSRLADDQGFVVVYPYGTKGEVDSGLSWNADYCCGTALFNMTNDVEFIRVLKNKIVAEYDIDPNKVYLAGFSNGALLTLKIASERPELFSGYGAMAGAVGGQGPGSDGSKIIKLPEAPVKLLMIHGKDDQSVPYAGGQSKYLGRIPSPISVVSFAESMDFWLAANMCKGVDSSSIEGVTRETGKACNEGGKFEAISVSGRGHFWLGGLVELAVYGKTKNVNTTDEFWRFFNEN